MKQLSITATAFICLFILTKPVYAFLTSYTDLWDISQGNIVTAHSALHHTWFFGQYGFNSDARNMFGGYFGWSSSVGGTGPHPQTYFTQDTGPGALHWVQWQTPSPITLRSFNLVAEHRVGLDMNSGGFSQFSLLRGEASGGPWTPLYELADTDPDGDLYYGGGPTYTEPWYLELAVNITPTAGQYWRAEFVQYGAGAVTVTELDGYDTFLSGPNVIPAPGALILGSIGVALVVWLHRRRTL